MRSILHRIVGESIKQLTYTKWVVEERIFQKDDHDHILQDHHHHVVIISIGNIVVEVGAAVLTNEGAHTMVGVLVKN